MAAEVKGALLMFATLGLLLSAACGGSDDTNALKTQVAALQTQVAQPAVTATATPATPPATPRPDIVVSIIYSCSISRPPERILQVQPKYPQGGGGICESAARTGKLRYDSGVDAGMVILDLRLDLSVRTPSGTTYNVAFGGPTSVSIGDPWPPK